MEKHQVSPEEWAMLVDDQWVNGRMYAQTAVWFLLGYYPPETKAEKDILAPLSARYRALYRTIKNVGGFVESRTPPTYSYNKFTESRYMSRPSASAWWVEQQKLIELYENKPELGRPPFLFKGERDVDSNPDGEAHDNAVKRRAPDYFVAALIPLLAEIAWRAGKQGLPFSTKEMPGQKADLQALAQKFQPAIPGSGNTPRTFDDYLSGLCQFKNGAKPSDFYRELFPEFFETP